MHRLFIISALFIALLIELSLLLLSFTSAQATTITVCNIGCDYATIQSAVNVSSPGDTILVASGRYTDNVTVTVTLNIRGAGALSTTIDGNMAGSVITVEPNTVVTITGFTITNGRGIAVDGEARGGGIYNWGVLTIISSTIKDNTARGADGVNVGEAGRYAYGGGIYNACLENSCGQLTLINSIVSGNTATGGHGADGDADHPAGDGGRAYGGGVCNRCSASNCGAVMLTSTLVVGNYTVGGDGGGSSGNNSGNGGHSYGGGIYNDGTGNVGGLITMTLGSVMNNYAHGGNTGKMLLGSPGIGQGGGSYNSGVMTLIASTVGQNSATSGSVGFPYYYGSSPGGGIYNSGQLTLIGSTVYNNDSNYGGGLYNGSGSFAELVNSTISGNSAYYTGGGIDHSGTMTLTNTTISRNRAGDGGFRVSGHRGGGINSNGLIYLRNTIIAENDVWDFYGPRGFDCFGTLTSQGHNLVQNASDCNIIGDTTGNIISRTAFLLPLQDNGGPTPTHALWFVSPAIDAGDPAYCPATDQRGMPRPTDGDSDGLAVCDIGAYEGYMPPVSRSYLPVILR